MSKPPESTSIAMKHADATLLASEHVMDTTANRLLTVLASPEQASVQEQVGGHKLYAELYHRPPISTAMHDRKVAEMDAEIDGERFE